MGVVRSRRRTYLRLRSDNYTPNAHRTRHRRYSNSDNNNSSSRNSKQPRPLRRGALQQCLPPPLTSSTSYLEYSAARSIVWSARVSFRPGFLASTTRPAKACLPTWPVRSKSVGREKGAKIAEG